MTVHFSVRIRHQLETEWTHFNSAEELRLQKREREGGVEATGKCEKPILHRHKELSPRR